jgi:two-component system response regulator DesR
VTNEPAPITVLISDDELLIRDAIASLLSLEDDIEVVGRAASGPEAVALARQLRPQVALLDLQMPGLDGIGVTEALRTEVPDCACMIVTSHARPGYLKAALTAGARAFLSKTTSASVLATAVRTVAAGGRFVDPELAAEAISAGDSPLTAREADVLALAAEGSPVDEIADRVALSSGTVRNYLSSAVTKLAVTNRHEAARKARQNGWI